MPKHRLSVGWSYQADDSADNVANWPGGFNGDSKRRPQVLTVNFTSTLSPAIVNEGRFGVTYGRNELQSAMVQQRLRRSGTARKLFLLSGGTNARNGAHIPWLSLPGPATLPSGTMS